MRKNEAKLRKKTTDKYIPVEIELKWQCVWEKEGTYQPDILSAKKPFYNLMMFPYPSAEGLHVGSVFAFSGVDIYGRFKRMQGNDVFEPIGLDGFGIHSENHAIKTGTHPMDHAKRTEENFYRQLHSIGNGFDWKHKLETYDPHYYKWTQWLFIELFKAGLAYRKKSPVNYCLSCKTVLADEQVIEGKCERCGSVVEKRELEQWFFRITKYADRLLTNIEKLNWTEKVKIAQRNWIGKKTGIRIRYEIENSEGQMANGNGYIEVFTTRPDTNFGATFVALAPDNEITQKVLSQVQDDKIRKDIKEYIEIVKNKSEIERQAEGREKTGVFTGLYAINPLTGYRMPVWVSDFVLSGFGTGAVVGVPGSDTRDFEFAQKFGLEVKRVVVGKDGDASLITGIEQVQEEEGTMVNSEFLDGMNIHEAAKKIMDYLDEKGYGKRETTYHLRDWLISRQRYWGPPIPMIYCEKCAEEGRSWLDTAEGKKYKGKGFCNDDWNTAGWYPVEEKNLPVKLPHIGDYKPMGTGKAPLANYPDFYETKCPGCGHKARRETDVSDTFLDSAWYFFRYVSTDRNDVAFDKEIVKKWLPVNAYIGGAEHSVLHLLYARFVTMVLYDLGYIEFEEPFARFYAHGLIIKDGAKMSKSKGNVINPDEYIRKFGADTLRAYLHFLGPFDEGGDFRDTGIEGMHRFMKRVWTLFIRTQSLKLKSQKLNEEALRIMHRTIKGVTEDLELLHYNTAIAKLMSYYNFLAKQEIVSKEEESVYLRLLAPFAPYMAEELWEKIGFQKNDTAWSIHSVGKWPEYVADFIEEAEVRIPVQVNGKLREMLVLSRNAVSDRKYVEKVAKKSEKVSKYLSGKVIHKVIYVPGKVINFVVK
jgi:leucyl-tRNA synthetase